MTLAAALLIAFVSGFISLSYEIVRFRAIAFASGGSAPTFALLLAFYLFGLAGGGLAARELFGRPGGAPASRIRLLLAGYVLLANLVGAAVCPLLAVFAALDVWLAALPFVALAAGLLGTVLPLVSYLAIAPDSNAGRRLSYVYAANIAGCALGSIATGYVLLDVLPLRDVALALLAAGFGLVGILVFEPSAVRRLAVAAGIVLGIGSAAWTTPRAFDRFYERLLYKGRSAEAPAFAHVVENRAGVVAVSPNGEVFGGGVYDGAINTDLVTDFNGIVRAYVVGALRPAPREVLVIGVATGAWAQVIAHLPSVERMTLVEINPGYLELARLYPQVASLLRNPKVEVVIDDGRRWLRRNPGRRYDLVVSNTTFHWRAQASNLLSREFLQLVRAHLRPGGVFYFNPTASAEAIHTAFAVFPYGCRFVNFVMASDAPIVLDSTQWAEVLRGYRIDGRRVLDPENPAHQQHVRDALALLEGGPGEDGQVALEWRESVLRRVAGARLITDDNMGTEWEQVDREIWLPPAY